MNLSEQQRELYCRRINENQTAFDGQSKQYWAEMLELERQMREIEARIRRLNTDLLSANDTPDRVPGRADDGRPKQRTVGRGLGPSILGVVSVEIQRARIREQISQAENDLTRVERRHQEARRKHAEARANFTESQDAHTRFRCEDFPS